MEGYVILSEGCTELTDFKAYTLFTPFWGFDFWLDWEVIKTLLCSVFLGVFGVAEEGYCGVVLWV